MHILQDIYTLLGDEGDQLLAHSCNTIPKDLIHKPSVKGVIDRFSISDRSKEVLRNLEHMYLHGRLSGTGYLSILPVDQGIEHGAGVSFAKNPSYFDPEWIVKLAIEGGCSAVASTAGALAMVSDAYADKIPFIVKLNHNDLLRYPNSYKQTLFASVEKAKNMGALGVGATIYFGSKQSRKQIPIIAEAFEEAHKQGLFTILWCYVRNDAFSVDGVSYETSADITGQANHLGVTIGADIIKQKLPTVMDGFPNLQDEEPYGKFSDEMYELMSKNPIDMARYQVANCYMGRIPMISSGGASGKSDIADAVRAAIINKRAGGSGLIMGRKAFQKSFAEGVSLLHTVQDVFASDSISIA